jgi:hypothetical protein
MAQLKYAPLFGGRRNPQPHMLRKRVTGGSSLYRRVLAFLDRNDRILRGLHQLRGYHLAPIALLPSVLELVSDLPTLLYRFVRWGYINALCDLLVARTARAAAAEAKQRLQQQRQQQQERHEEEEEGPARLPSGDDSPASRFSTSCGIGGSGGVLGASRHLLGKAPWP